MTVLVYDDYVAYWKLPDPDPVSTAFPIVVACTLRDPGSWTRNMVDSVSVEVVLRITWLVFTPPLQQ